MSETTTPTTSAYEPGSPRTARPTSDPAAPVRAGLAGALLTALALALLSAWLVARAANPPAPVPATAPATEFSAERAMTHVRAIAERPHPIGSADHERVRGYIVSQLAALGLDPQVQEATGIGTRYQAVGRVRNVLARLPGTEPGGQAVLLMAHYDGVGAGPAAGDDASGSSVLLETLRALRAGPRLRHDVIALFSDGEEAGLLGAAAFVREHPWAKDVGVALDFEARGTTGRSYMFETGPGNLDAVRVLGGVGDVSATSLSVTVYRTLPNDTDLSEIAVLGRPALNFAFADGVERYHTTRDDVAHLNPGSVQHDGTQALALARAFGDGPLPRPVTGDAVFFDMPVVGLVVYPETWALPIAIVALALALAVLWRVRREPRPVRGVVLGVAGTLVAACLAIAAAMASTIALAALHRAIGSGNPMWSGVYATALALLALALTAACWSVVRRWASARGAHAGALLVWAVLALLVTIVAPGGSFLLVWPLIFAAIAALFRGASGDGLAALAALVAAAILVPIAYSIGAVLLGVAGAGGIVEAVVVALLAWLLAPQLEAMNVGGRATAAWGALAAALVLFVVGAATVRTSPDNPAPSLLVYAADADSGGAWLATPGTAARAGSWAAMAVGPSARPAGEPGGPPAWVARSLGRTVPMLAASAPRVPLGAPEATVLADSAAGETRRLVLRIRPASGMRTIDVSAPATRVLAAAVDGRAIDTTRYRRPSPTWAITYSAPPDSGFTLALTLPAGADASIELTGWTDGIPALPGRAIPPRPEGVVPVQSGDGTAVRRAARFAGGPGTGSRD